MHTGRNWDRGWQFLSVLQVTFRNSVKALPQELIEVSPWRDGLMIMFCGPWNKIKKEMAASAANGLTFFKVQYLIPSNDL